MACYTCGVICGVQPLWEREGQREVARCLGVRWPDPTRRPAIFFFDLACKRQPIYAHIRIPTGPEHLTWTTGKVLSITQGKECSPPPDRFTFWAKPNSNAKREFQYLLDKALLKRQKRIPFNRQNYLSPGLKSPVPLVDPSCTT